MRTGCLRYSAAVSQCSARSSNSPLAVVRTILYISLERGPKVHVQASGGYQLKMPPHAVIGAPTQYCERRLAPMGVLREKAGRDPTLRGIGRRLREDSEDTTREPLPERWVDLIHRLNERERMQSEHLPQVEEPKSDMRARAAGDFTPPLITAEVLNALLDTSYASPRTNAVLRDLRQNIQRSTRGKPQARRIR